MRCLSLVSLLLPTGALADVPRVAVDIAPVHSLVATVMGELGTPALFLPQGDSAHGADMRPSEARALSGADLVVWIGPALNPSVEDSIATLADGAEVMVVLDALADTALPVREIEALGHDHDHDDHDHDHGDHDHAGAVDPHIWLDPHQGRAMLTLLADALSELDPDNAESYGANAQAGIEDLIALESRIVEVLAPVRDQPFVVPHDAYQYFEMRFGLVVAGTVAANDAAPPSPRHLIELRESLADGDVSCLFTETGGSGRTAEVLVGDLGLRSGELDPLGDLIQPGPAHYGATLTALATAIAGCLAP